MNTLQRLESQNIDIRPMQQTDIEELAKRDKTLATWHAYYRQHEAGERYTCVITKDNRIVGYGSLLAESTYTPFEQDEVFEISDLWVAPSERRQGLATLLITYFESIAHDEDATQIGMGIGVDGTHAACHCLCIRLGYTPDGTGLTYKGIPVVPDKQYPVDNNLRLWFVKDLTATEQDSE